MRLVVVCPKMDGNALGRAYCWWLIGQELDVPVRVTGPGRRGLWPPLEGSDFADHCSVHPPRAFPRALSDQARDTDVLIGMKLWPGGADVAMDVARVRMLPVIIDIDDPDDAAIGAPPEGPALRRAAVRLTQARKGSALRKAVEGIKAQAAHQVCVVSNPVLQNTYGGIVVPHVRRPPVRTAPHTTASPRVGFIGTNRRYKGLPVLRSAVERLVPEGYSLVVTDKAPPDARPWEEWLGSIPLETLPELIADVDIVAAPSSRDPFSEAQLPVKLVDGMLGARAVVGSDLPPIRWALGAAAHYCVPGSVDSLIEALRGFQRPSTRERYGRRAREQALKRFTPQCVAPAVAEAVEAAQGLAQGRR